MCYAIPGKVVGLDANRAIVDYFGEQRNVLNELLEIKVGDYVYAQGGILVSKIPEKEASEILRAWKEVFFGLKKVDRELARAGEQRFVNKKLSKSKMLALLRLKSKDDLKSLCQTANAIRQKEHGNACCVHGIIEFSNYCRNNCFYCGIRRDNGRIERYRMGVDEIVNVAKSAVNEFGFKALVLQSGEDFWYDEKKLIRLVEEIRKLGVLIFLSVGARSKKVYARLYKAGARAALLRFETSNKKIFEKLRPGTSLEERINLIKYLKKIGYIVATGFLAGLPTESEEDIVNNILLTKSLKADMYSFGPLIPAENTPLQNQKLINKDTLLKVIAVSRLADRQAKILITTALETLDKNAKKEGLLAGANSLMINVTPIKYRKKYAIYPGRPDKNIDLAGHIKSTVNLLYSLGRAPVDLGI